MDSPVNNNQNPLDDRLVAVQQAIVRLPMRTEPEIQQRIIDEVVGRRDSAPPADGQSSSWMMRDYPLRVAKNSNADLIVSNPLKYSPDYIFRFDGTLDWQWLDTPITSLVQSEKKSRISL